MKKIVTVLLCIVFICSVSSVVFADAATYDMAPAGYYVYVQTPDGGLNMRQGPGTEYNKIMEDTIPDYTELYIEYISGNWGYTKYEGKYGWVALSQTTETPPSSLDVAPNKKDAGYYVYVSTPDGGLNMRQGPGTNYAKSLDGIIPDYTKLYIVYTSNGWGYTEFMGSVGWVALNQTTTTEPVQEKPVSDDKEETITEGNVSVADENTDAVEEDAPVEIKEPPVQQETEPTPAEDESTITTDTKSESSAPVYQILLIASILLLTCTVAVVGIVLINKKTKQ